MPKTKKKTDFLTPDKYIGIPIIVGTKATRTTEFPTDELNVSYEWEFYIRSVYTLPTIYGFNDFTFTEKSDGILPAVNTLQFIDKVGINLHSSFVNPNFELTFDSIKDSSDGNEFMHKNKGWGEFEIKATLFLKNNKQIKISHYLKLHVQDPESRVVPDNLLENQSENVVISERIETIILKNPPPLILQNWNLYYSDLCTFNLDMKIDQDESVRKNIPNKKNWFRHKKFGETEEKKIDEAFKYILEKIGNVKKEEDQ